MIKERKTPHTWDEMVADGKKGHIETVRFYRKAADQAGEKFSYRGLYFFITKEDEVYYIGIRKDNIMNRLYAHKGDENKTKCHIAIVNFPSNITYQHLKFYEAMFIALCHPTANKQYNKSWHSDRFGFLSSKNITIDETYTIRTYHKPE